MDKGCVLSFSNDQETLVDRESALCNAGFFVVSVASEAQARFEIVMGLCGHTNLTRAPIRHNLSVIVLTSNSSLSG
jgi:hypothetical protein